VCKVCFRSVRAGGHDEWKFCCKFAMKRVERLSSSYITSRGRKTDRLCLSKQGMRKRSDSQTFLHSAVMLQPVTLLAQFPVRPISQRPGFLGRSPSVLNLYLR
jgi:hypothetical protein